MSSGVKSVSSYSPKSYFSHKPSVRSHEKPRSKWSHQPKDTIMEERIPCPLRSNSANPTPIRNRAPLHTQASFAAIHEVEESQLEFMKQPIIPVKRFGPDFTASKRMFSPDDRKVRGVKKVRWKEEDTSGSVQREDGNLETERRANQLKLGPNGFVHEEY